MSRKPKAEPTPEEVKRVHINAWKRAMRARFCYQAEHERGPLDIYIGDYMPPESYDLQACFDAGWGVGSLEAEIDKCEALREMEEDGEIVEVMRLTAGGVKVLASHVDRWRTRWGNQATGGTA